MAVTLFVCPSLASSNISSPSEFSDSLAGGGTGLNLGQVVNGLYAPIVNKAANTGAQEIFISHDATIDPITNLRVNIEPFSASYGGAVSASNDFTKIVNEGSLSSNGSGDKNNANGTASGLWMDFDRSISEVNQFDVNTRPSTVKIFGKAGAGVDEGSSIIVPSEAMCYSPAPTSESTPTAPEDGKIGTSTVGGFGGDSTLGNRAKIKTRIYLRSAFEDGGVFQVDYVFRYSFTA